MGLPSIIAALRKAARELLSSTAKPGCQKIFTSLENVRGESPCPIQSKECCETLYSMVFGGNSGCNSDRAFFDLARACLICRSKFAPALACTAASYTPPYELRNIHMFRKVMNKTADIPKWTTRNTNDDPEPTPASQSSHVWTATQILTPILVGIVLCLTFALWFLYKSGRFSRLTTILTSMRRGRAPRNRWTIDDDDPSSGALHHVPEAEAMIDPGLHWRSLSSRDDFTDRRRYNTRMGMGALTPAFSKVTVPFDLEDPVTGADAPRSTSSRSGRNGPSIVGRNSGSTFDRIPSPHNLTNNPSRSSAALESVLDNGQEIYENTGNVLEGDGANDHDDETDDGNRVMLISRNGEDFSLSGSMASVPICRRSSEVDRRSTEVVPPSPHTIGKQPFRRNPSIARSASTPLLCPPSSEMSHIRPSPSTNDLSNFHFLPIPKPSFMSPTHFAMRSAASSGVQPPLRDGPGKHLFTTATPPIDHDSIGSNPYGSLNMEALNMASTHTLPPNTYSPLTPTGYSPSASPDLQNYIPSSPGRSTPRSAYYLPPGPVPVSSRRIGAPDPQNMIPPAVRTAGYNPFQHGRSVSAFQ